MQVFRCVLVLFAALPLGLSAADSGEENAILATVQRVFDSMAAHDGAAIRSAMTADARITPIRCDEPGAAVSVEQFAHGVEVNHSRLLERMWAPKVMVRGRLASVWSEYDFHRDGKFTHCGIDAFLLVKTADGWKISSIAYTAETEGCAPSPLGPPK
jgi:hypothetical protein